MLDPAFTSSLANVLPKASLLTAAEDTRPYECDGLTLYRQQPAAVLLPDNEAQVVAILRLCHAAHVPVVARGAGTSLSGGAIRSRGPRSSSLAFATSRYPKQPRATDCSMRRIRRRKSHARSVATSPRTLAVSIA